MPKVNCLESAKKAYGDDIENEDITNLYDQLEKHRKMAENAGMDVFEELSNFSKEADKAHEFNAKVEMYQALLKGQVIADNLQREELFRQAGFKPENSVRRSLLSKMAGTSDKVARNHDNTWSRAQQATTAFYESFAKAIQGDLLPLFNSKTGQQELINAMYAVRRGEKVDSQFGKLAKIIIDFQDKALQNAKEVGIFISPLEDRLAPNIWDARRMQSLTRAERKEALRLYPESESPDYEFAYQRWKQDMLPALIEDRTFTARGVDVNDPKAVDKFMLEAFDNLVNKGKSSQENVNFANKFKQQRVLHMKPESIIAINEKYGSGSIQESILTELASMAGRTEVFRDWTVNPVNALDATLEVMDQNPTIAKRFGKGKEYEELKGILRYLTVRDRVDPNWVDNIFMGFRIFGTITKLGKAMLSSIPDLHNTAKALRPLGVTKLQTYAGVIKNMMPYGMSAAEKQTISNFLNSGLAAKLSSFNRYMVNPYKPSSLAGWAQHWEYKLSLLHRWDQSNRAFVVSNISQYFAKNRHVTWDRIPEREKNALAEYNIGEDDWDVIRSSSVKSPKGHAPVITPDGVQNVSRETIAEILKRQGVENPSDMRIQRYKDSVERKLNTYYRDRQDHAIATPDVVDKYMLSFGEDSNNRVWRGLMQGMMQFKHFGFSMFRKTILPTLREKGATNLSEALNPLSGKSNWTGMGAMATELMALAYVGMAAKNVAVNLTPPSLGKWDTWEKMLADSLGAVSVIFNIDFHDLKRSLGGIVGGVQVGEMTQLLGLGFAASQEYGKGLGYDKTKKASYQLLKSNIPFNQFYTQLLANHFFLNAVEDWAYPGKRQQDLQQLEERTGAKPLF